MTTLETVGIAINLATLAYVLVLFWFARQARRNDEPAWERHYTTLAHIWLVVLALGGLK